MQTINEYQGRLLNHFNALYRPGERRLALALVEALGFAFSDTGFASDAGETFVGVHPEPTDVDMQNNAFYIAEMTPEHLRYEKRLQTLAESDTEVAEALAGYRAKARSRPFGSPHIGIKYHSLQDLEAALERLRAALGETLGERMHIAVYPPQSEAGTTQAFIHQDVIVSGNFLLGQLIELQAQ
jgi:hypothetical protein